jgi:DNA invertase Pin-like site-specific DNA recombinase
VEFRALDIPEANTLTLGIMATLAQHERELISDRTRKALAARRARGLALGTPRDLSAYAQRASALGHKANHAKALSRAKEIAPQIEAAVAAGHTSLRKIAAHLNGLEIPTPRGKSWTATAVKNAQRLLHK